MNSQAQLQVSPNYSYAQTPPPPTTMMENAVKQAEKHVELLISVAERLERLRDCLLGAEPAPQGSNGGSPMPTGSAYMLSLRFEQATAVIQRLEGITTDLERFA